MQTPRGFQSFIVEQCRSPPNARDIFYWYNQSRAGAGVTELVKHMRASPDAMRLPPGSAQRMKTAIIEQGACRSYLVDLPRMLGPSQQKELVSTLEELKSGEVEVTVHGKTEKLSMDPPHIHVFSNALPNLVTTSMDRWRIFTIYDHHFDDGAADAAAGEDGPPEQHFLELELSEVVELQRLAKEKEHAGTKRCACEIE